MGKVVKLGWMQVDVIGEDEEVDREKGGMEGFYFLSNVGTRINIRGKIKENKVNKLLSHFPHQNYG